MQFMERRTLSIENYSSSQKSMDIPLKLMRQIIRLDNILSSNEYYYYQFALMHVPNIWHYISNSQFPI